MQKITDDLLKKTLRQISKRNHFPNNKVKEAIKTILRRESSVISEELILNSRNDIHCVVYQKFIRYVLLLTGEKDVLVSMPTGCKKSLCFQLPGVLQENKTTIVFSPSISLMMDQIHNLEKSKICAKSMTSETSDEGIRIELSCWSWKIDYTTIFYFRPRMAIERSYERKTKNYISLCHPRAGANQIV